MEDAANKRYTFKVEEEGPLTKSVVAKSAAMDKKNIRKAVFSEAKVTNTYLIFNLKIEAVSLVYLARFTFLTRLTFTTWTCDFTFESSGNSGVGHNRNDELKH